MGSHKKMNKEIKSINRRNFIAIMLVTGGVGGYILSKLLRYGFSFQLLIMSILMIIGAIVILKFFDDNATKKRNKIMIEEL